MKEKTSVEQVRHFNRFYTKLLGLLDNKISKTAYSLVEARILFELHQNRLSSASELVKVLNLDPSYVSRILKKFETGGLLHRNRCVEDCRKQRIELTDAGKIVFLDLQEISNNQIGELMHPLSDPEISDLLGAMAKIERLFSGLGQSADFITFRTHQPGDIGYLTYQHSRFYAREYGFDITFDAYVAGAMVKFIENYSADKERLWVVEQDGQIMGSIAIVDAGEGVAQLRWFILEPEVHGKGIGKKLMSDAVQFCRDKKYSTVILWTFKDLTAARSLYEKEGFEVTKTERHEIWGQKIEEELWTLPLA